jgi:hypothetical protein
VAWSSFKAADLRAVAALPAQERRLLAQAMLIVPMIGVLVKLTGFRRLQHMLSRVVPIAPISGDPLIEAATINRLVSVAADRGPIPATCLSRSLALWVLLRRHGVEADVCLGVRGGIGRLHGHAWVEYRGQPLNETGDVRERFAVMDAPAPKA